MIRIMHYGQEPNEKIFARGGASAADVSGAVKQIIDTVRRDGDAALYAHTKQFDHAELSSLAVTPEEMQKALSEAEPEFLD